MPRWPASARRPPPPALAAIDAAVFARIDAAPPAAPLRAGVLAAVGAVAIGVASAGLAPAPAQASPVLDSATALAPSTLLSGLLR
ncbi:hypothetical protein [Sphingomonas solaris]|uniref:hypothetical protein n=1 Tax=Alterirhizorhabdus solaris TaxID=2529389 RepID=UPI001EF11DED|nr:hypothetical protein [Sphingomonas solaris]